MMELFLLLPLITLVLSVMLWYYSFNSKSDSTLSYKVTLFLLFIVTMWIFWIRSYPVALSRVTLAIYVSLFFGICLFVVMIIWYNLYWNYKNFKRFNLLQKILFIISIFIYLFVCFWIYFNLFLDIFT